MHDPDMKLPPESRDKMPHADIDPDMTRIRIERNLDYMTKQIAALEARLPSKEQLEYLARKTEDYESVSRTAKIIRAHLPWVSVITAALSAIMYYILTHNITINTK